MPVSIIKIISDSLDHVRNNICLSQKYRSAEYCGLGGSILLRFLEHGSSITRSLIQMIRHLLPFSWRQISIWLKTSPRRISFLREIYVEAVKIHCRSFLEGEVLNNFPVQKIKKL